MPPPPDSSGPDVTSPTVNYRREEVLDRFEAAWRRGARPVLAEYVAQVSEPERDGLLRELLRLDTDYRRQAGKTPQASDYIALLPQYRRAIVDVFSDKRATTPPPRPTSPAGAETGAAVGPAASIQTSQSEGTISGSVNKAGEDCKPLRNFGRYRIERELGKGAMGTVYLADDTQLGRKVALKIPQKSSLQDADALERFYREARTSGMLRHPNICPVYDVGAIDGTHYITMAYIPGKPVSSYLGKAKLPAARPVALLIRKIAQALEEAHKHGVIHRDLKPSNVMLDDRNEPVVMDFGLARQMNLAEDVRLTQSGAILGTPAYMSPEQVNGDLLRVGPTSDIYSLGVMLYQFLTGKLPFEGPVMQVLAQIMRDQPKLPSEVRPEVDRSLEVICRKMMAKEIGERYASMKEVVAALTEYLKTGAVTALEATFTAVSTMPGRKPGSVFENLATFPDFDHEQRKPRSRRRSKSKTSPIFQWTWPVIGTVTGAALIALFAVVIMLRNGSVAVKVHIDDPTAVVKIDGRQVQINGDGLGEVRLTIDKHSYTIERNGETIRQPEEFTITKAGKKELEITLVADPGDRSKVEIGNASSVAPNTGWHGWPADAPKPAIAPFDAAQAKKHQEEWAAYLKVPVEWESSIGMKFRLIPPGEFLVGDQTEGRRRHQVILTRPLYVGTTEVTQHDFVAVMETNPSHFVPNSAGLDLTAMDSDKCPVEQVSWLMADEFCRKLSLREKRPFRLLTEAEWEFACRAGTSTRFNTGDEIANLRTSGWYDKTAGQRTNIAGKLKANAFGLYDMHGNVWEWCLDWYGQSYYESNETVDPTGPTEGEFRVFRGGSWFAEGSDRACWSSARALAIPLQQAPDVGFRVAIPVESNTGWHGWPVDAPKPAIAPFDASPAKKHQEEWAAYLKVPVEYENSLGMKFRLIPPGEFLMGSTAAEIEVALKEVGEDKYRQDYIKSEAPPHKVVLTQPIYLGVHEVTQADYEKVMGTNPSWFAKTGAEQQYVEKVARLDTTRHPVENVSWNDAGEFCTKLSQQEKLKPFYFRAGETVTPLDGTGYRLSTEAEWEFACRAGTTTKYWIGDQNEKLVLAAWLWTNSSDRTHAVGEIKANPFGLFDMHGNVWEWVHDGWDPAFYGQFQDRPAINPNSPFSTASQRVIRGSSWYTAGFVCRSSNRDAHDPAYRYGDVGFRVSLPVEAVRQALKMTGPPAHFTGAGAKLNLSDWLTSPDYKWTEPQDLGPVINFTAYNYCPRVSNDGLELWFTGNLVTADARSKGQDDLWISRRESLNHPWKPPVNAGEPINTPDVEKEFSLTSDGLSIFLKSWAREGISISTRAGRDQPWSLPQAIPNLNQHANFPVVSPDGLTLFVEFLPETGGLGGKDICVTTRKTLNDPWSKLTVLPEPMNSSADEEPCWVSADGTTMLLSSNREGGMGDHDLWVATRTSGGTAWEKPVNLGKDINTEKGEHTAHFSPDSQTLWFTRVIDGQGPYFQIFQSQRVAKESVTTIETPIQSATPNKPEYEAVFGLEEVALDKWLSELGARGVCPSYISVHTGSPVARFNAIAVKRQEPLSFVYQLNMEDAQAKASWDQWSPTRQNNITVFYPRGNELKELHVYQDNPDRRGWRSWTRIGIENMRKQWEDEKLNDMRPVHMFAPTSSGQEKFSTQFVYDKGTRWEVLSDISPKNLRAQCNGYRDRGLRPELLYSYWSGQEIRCMVLLIDDATKPDWELEQDISPKKLKTQLQEKSQNGFRPVSIISYGSLGSPRHSVLWLQNPALIE